ncbi:MAG: Kae1-associated serine/threonine protein kinase [Candidatus Methanomethylicus sp.]|nr:Kae1-associated serine/threonine protein kinase [Candidatus Methanomethylicus sp.]
MAEMNLKLIKKGAEAELYRGQWLGYDAIFKRRVRKEYRNADLDAYIRGSRTSLEAKLLAQARKLGVPTPVVLFVDLRNYEIIMNHIPGISVKKLIDTLDVPSVKSLFSTIGEMVGRLHLGGLVHGDLTTSNILVFNNSVFFIDFGLGEYTSELEARGVDIHLMRRALESSHHAVSKVAYTSFIDGYKGIMKEMGKEILIRVDEIRRRGRYVEGER